MSMSNRLAVRVRGVLGKAVAGVALVAVAASAQAQVDFAPGGNGSAGSGAWNTNGINFTAAGVPTLYPVSPTAGPVAVFSKPGSVLVNGAEIVTAGVASADNSGIRVGGITATESLYVRRVGSVLPVFEAADGSVFNIASGKRVYVRNTINNVGSYTVTGGGTLALGGGNDGLGNVGTVSITGNSTVQIINSAGNAVLPTNLGFDIASGSTLDMGLTTDDFGGISGAGTIRLGSQVFGVVTGTRIRATSANNLTFSGNIIGDGGRFEKGGDGTLTLSGVNTFKSHASIIAGTLRLSGGSAMDDLAQVYLNTAATGTAARLEITSNETIGMLAGGSTVHGLTSIGSNTLTVNQARPYSLFNGALDGTGTFVKAGPGAMTFANAAPTAALANNFAGKYVISGGILSFRNDDQAGAVSRIGASPASLVQDYFTLAGGSLSNNSLGGYAMNSNRGITVVADSGIRVIGSTASALVLSAPIVGASGVTVTKGQVGILSMNGDSPNYQGNWLVESGTLRTQATTGTPLGTGTITVNSAVLSFQPTDAAGANHSVSTGGIVYNEGSILNLDRGSTSGSLKVNAASLTPGTRGTLVVQAIRGGIAGLGTSTGESLVASSFPTTTNGILPGVVVNGGAGSSLGSHVGYDTTFGIVPAVYTSTDLNAAGASDVVDVLGGASTLSSSKTVFAARLGASALDLSGNTLTIGDGTLPGTLILNASANPTNGTISFGTSQGVIYAANTVGTLSASLAGSNGVSFVGIYNSNPTPLTINTAATYSGPTSITGGGIRLDGTNILPVGTELSVENGPFGSTPASVSLNLVGNSQQSVAKITSKDRTAFIAVNDGKLTVTGAGTSEIINPVLGSNQGTVEVTGGGTLILGNLNNNGVNNNAADNLPAGPTGSTINGTTNASLYGRLNILNGSTVRLSSATVLPQADGADQTRILLNGGTLSIDAINSAGQYQSGASTFTLAGATHRRGIEIGSNGGTIRVSDAQEIVLFQRANGIVADQNADLLRGSDANAVLTLQGPGVFRVGVGNSFAGKWNIDGGFLQFQTDDAVGTNPGTNALGATPGSVVADGITLKNGGTLQSNASGIINANRGITIGEGGGRIVNGALRINSALSGTGNLTLTGSLAPTATSVASFFGASPNYSGDVILENGSAVVGISGALGTGVIRYNAPTTALLGRSSIAGTPDVELANNIALTGIGNFDIQTGGTAGGFLTLLGNISGSSPIDVVSAGTAQSSLALVGDNSAYTGPISLITGGINVSSPTALGAVSAGTVVNSGGRLTIENVVYNAAEPVTMLSQIITDQPAATQRGNNSTFGYFDFPASPGFAAKFAGPITVSTPANPLATVFFNTTSNSLELSGGIKGAGNITAIGAGTLEVASVDVLTMVIGTAATATPTPSAPAFVTVTEGGALANRVTGLSFVDPAATLNLTDNDLIVDYTGTSPIGALITSLLGGQLLANGDFGGLPTYLAIAEAADLGLTDFGGRTVDDSAVLVKYTYVGDANLDGQVDALDYERIDLAIGNTGVFGVAQGDLNYDGNVDALDYEQVDLNIGNGVGSPLAGVTGGVFIPEPASLSVLALGAGLMGRRRRM